MEVLNKDFDLIFIEHFFSYAKNSNNVNIFSTLGKYIVGGV